MPSSSLRLKGMANTASRSRMGSAPWTMDPFAYSLKKFLEGGPAAFNARQHLYEF